MLVVFLIHFSNGGQNTLKLNGTNIYDKLTIVSGGGILTNNNKYQYVGELKVGDVLSATVGGFQPYLLIAKVE